MCVKIDPDEVLLELVRAGPLVRVSATELKSLTEVLIYGPARAGGAALCRIGLLKLHCVLARQGYRRLAR